MSIRVHLWFLTLILSVSPLPGTDDSIASQSIKAWKSVLKLDYRPAEEIFREIAETHSDSAREASFSRAAVLLSVQPRTSRNVERAYSIFEDVASKEPNDALGLEARYFLARIHHVHAFNQDFVEAERRYRELIDQAWESYPGQLSVLKLTILRLFRVDRPEQRIHSINEFEPLGRHLSHPGLRFSFHMVLADTLQIHDLDDVRAFHHLRAAYALSSPTFRIREQLIARLSQLAIALGEKELAQIYLTEFLQSYPRSSRVNYLAFQLEKLRSGS